MSADQFWDAVEALVTEPVRDRWTGAWPCGSHRCEVCPINGRGRRAVVWSQVMSVHNLENRFVAQQWSLWHEQRRTPAERSARDLRLYRLREAIRQHYRMSVVATPIAQIIVTDIS